ncbi:hypothetical protein SAMN05660236_4477 [Ohtaekwangia koreensis]|uniref:Uncharacterized protein n=1 Tax=Ohtaekwangia koreensis TaxID=688867 RepID=A0A1T5M5P8_9BACT|nr:hypothetical protein SAMN05660236_4477 [Ohtaekwangia koreensis]
MIFCVVEKHRMHAKERPGRISDVVYSYPFYSSQQLIDNLFVSKPFTLGYTFVVLHMLLPFVFVMSAAWVRLYSGYIAFSIRQNNSSL